MREVVDIHDDDNLLRRYHLRPKKHHFVNGRLNPDIFFDAAGRPDPECSVFAESLMAHEREWCEPDTPGNMGLVSIAARVPRDAGARVAHAPNIPGRVVPYSHTHIFGLTPAMCQQLVSLCVRLEVEPSPFTRRT